MAGPTTSPNPNPGGGSRHTARPAPSPTGRSRRVPRTVVVLLAAVGLTGLFAAPSAAAPRSRPFPIDLQRTSIAQLQQAMASNLVTSRQLVSEYLERIRLLNTHGPGLNAVRVLTPDALEQASRLDAERRHHRVRGPLHGVPVLVKDNIDVAGLPTTAGTLALRDSFPRRDAFLVTRLRAAGAVILGKANLTEFANFTTAGMPSGYSGLGGQVLNPYDASQTPSGSSSGPAVAAAAALATITGGTETSASIVSAPVASCVAAVKPTVGLVSRSGVLPISSTQDTP